MTKELAKGFDGANLKVKRAYRHIDELKSVIDEISRLNTDSLIAKAQADGRHNLGFDEFGDTGMAASLIIGDAVHNLRSAFDHLWMTLYRETGKSGFDYFPFHKARQNIEDAVSKSAVKVAFPDVESLILDKIRPYSDPDGDALVWAITKFDNLDKHNLIIPTLHAHKIENMVVKIPNGPVINIQGATFGGGGSLINAGAKAEYENKGEITVEVTFSQIGEFLPGEPVLPSLLNMAEATSKSVELFRRTFL